MIEVRKNYSIGEQSALVEAVHESLVNAFKIKSLDKTIRLLNHQPHCFSCPPSLSKPECFTLITIDAFSGRSTQTKRILYKEIIGRLEQLGIPADHILILLRETMRENWGIRGGQAACDVKLGYQLNF